MTARRQHTNNSMAADCHRIRVQRSVHSTIARPAFETSAVVAGSSICNAGTGLFGVEHHPKTFFTTKDPHYPVHGFVPLLLTQCESFGVIGSGHNFSSVNLESPLDRHGLQQIREDFCSTCCVRGVFRIAGRSRLAQIGQVLAPLIQHCLAFLRSEASATIVERNSDSIQRVNVGCAHSRRARVHQRREYPRTHICRLARSLHPLLRLNGENRPENSGKNDQTVAYRNRTSDRRRGSRLRSRSDESEHIGTPGQCSRILPWGSTVIDNLHPAFGVAVQRIGHDLASMSGGDLQFAGPATVRAREARGLALRHLAEGDMDEAVTVMVHAQGGAR